ncbi:hypothetical protein ApDm4_1041 [Acetobacter pomorum]|nr:hypothetical protein ApDm4_1041 [Acetobacter pomorum]
MSQQGSNEDVFVLALLDKAQIIAHILTTGRSAQKVPLQIIEMYYRSRP